VRFSKTPIEPTRGAPVLGEHTEPVLREFGFTADEIDSLRSAGVVR
jgi:crotonobetainyl-CoA:carnitine CoA-transferase CaiB-like acyl-CoA transferase